MKAGHGNDWLELLKSDELNPWTRVKLQECYQVRQKDDQRKSIVQMMQKHGLPEADHRANPRAGMGHILVRVPSLPLFPD